jgi:hypothetical protein
MEGSQKQDPGFTFAQALLDPTGDILIPLPDQGIAPGLVPSAAGRRPPRALFIQNRFMQLVFLDHQLGRFSPHQGGALAHQAEQELTIPTPAPGQRMDNFHFPSANRQPILVQANLRVEKTPARDGLLDLFPMPFDQVLFSPQSAYPLLQQRRSSHLFAENSQIRPAMDDGDVN